MIKKLAGILTAGLLGFGSAQAAVIDVSHTFDLTEGFAQIRTMPGSPVSIGNGDSVSLNFDFAGNQTLSIDDGGERLMPWIFTFVSNGAFTINNIVIDLLDFTGVGGAVSSYTIPTQSSINSGFSSLGPDLMDFLSPGQSVTFSGLHVTFDVASLGTNPTLYSMAAFIPSGTNLRIGELVQQQVPEPGSLALLGVAMAGLGLARAARGKSA